MISKAEARRIRGIIETSVANTVDDKTASTVASLLPGLKNDGSPLEAGSRINWKGTVKRAKVTLWQRVDQNPDNAPTLWDDILYKDGIRIIPAVITAELKFGMDELGWWTDGLIYQSKLEVNTWTPAEHPDGWKVYES